MRTLRWARVLVLVLALALAGCGGGSGDDAGGATEAAGDGAAGATDDGAGAATEEAPTDGGGSAPSEGIGPLEPSEPFGLTQITLRSPEGDGTDVPVYVADDPQTRQRGLMFREELPAGTGMIFVFPGETTGGFWMANTLIPLSIAFYDADGTVVAVLDMEPCTEEDLNDCPSYEPGVPYHGALEVNQGFFDEIGLTEGWTVEVPQGISADS